MISGVSDLSSKLGIVSTAGTIYVGKTNTFDIDDMLATDLYTVGMYDSGTFNWTGEAPTVTDKTYEDGTVYFSPAQMGTEGFAGEIPDLSSEVLTFFMQGASITNTEWTGILKDYDLLAVGANMPVLDGYTVMLEFKQGGAWDYLIYPNAKITTSKAGSGSADGNITLSIDVRANVVTADSAPAGVKGNNAIWAKKKPASEG